MRALFYFAFVILISNVLSADLVIDPRELTKRELPQDKKEKSNQFPGQFYDSYLVNGEVIFHVLEQFTPIVNRLKETALRNGKFLKLRESAIIHFSDATNIQRIIKISRQDLSHCVEVDPNIIVLSEIRRKVDGLHYLISIDKHSVEITKSNFDELSAAKALALLEKKPLKIDAKKLGLKKISFEIPTSNKNSPQMECVVCMNKEKEILLEPCNHLCLCPDCSNDIKKTCPLCNGEITSRKKVFF